MRVLVKLVSNLQILGVPTQIEKVDADLQPFHTSSAWNARQRMPVFTSPHLSASDGRRLYAVVYSNRRDVFPNKL